MTAEFMSHQLMLFYTSVAIFVLGTIFVFILSSFVRIGSKRKIALLFLVNAGALMPLYLNGHRDAQGGIIDSVISAALGIIKIFRGDGELEVTRDMLGTLPSDFIAIAAIYTGIVHLVMSALLLGFILSLFKDFFPKLKFKLSPRVKLNVFSQLNQRSMLLAQDIRKTNKRTRIVFLNTSSDINIDISVMLEKASEINAFVFDIGLCDLKIPLLIRETNFFLLKVDERENIKDFLQLAEMYNKGKHLRKKIKLHILSSQSEVEIFVDSTALNPKSNMTFRIIKENRLMLYNLYNKLPLFLAKKNDELEMLIIGIGRKGIEAAKVAAWCAQTLKCKPRIILVDKDGEIESKFEKDCPGLYMRTAEPEAKQNCEIVFEKFDVEGGDFTPMLKKHPNVGYVICTLGDDRLNLRTAITVRSVYEEIKFENDEKVTSLPFINVLIKDPHLYNVTKNLKYDKRVDCNLLPFGSLEETYTWNNLVTPYLDSLGMAFNRFYVQHFASNKIDAAKTEKERQAIIDEVNKGADQNYERSEYERASSIALALHSKYKIYACLIEYAGKEFVPKDWLGRPKKEKMEEIVTEINAIFADEKTGAICMEELAKLEHTRWNLNLLSTGWRSCTTEQADTWFEAFKGHRNFAAKLHPCIIPWENLEALDKWKDSWTLEKTGKPSDFKELDRLMIKKLPEILLWAEDIVTD